MISVITASYNADRYISRLIFSLQAQAFKNFEWIVADGGSTDGTLDLLQKVEGLNLVVDSRPDSGVYDAYNRGVALSSGDYLLFLGADDYLIADLASLATTLVDDKTIYYGDVYMPKKHVLFGGEYTRRRLAYHNICHQSVFYPRAVFTKYSYDLKYRIWADYDLNVRCMADNDLKFQYIKKLISFYNDCGGISDNFEDSLFLKNQIRLVYKYFPLQDFALFIARKVAIKVIKNFFSF